MDAAQFLTHAAAHELDLIPRNDRLEVIGPLTDDLRAVIRQHKPEILEQLHGIPLAELRRIAGTDWPEIENDPDLIECFANLVATRWARERGERPLSYTKQVTCAHCGSVWLPLEMPDEMTCCFWCLNRLAGRPIPRPAAS